MVVEAPTRQSRRAFLAVAAGGIGAVLARAAGAPVVRAADNDPVLLGVENDAESTTVITGPADGSTDVAVSIQGIGTSGTAILGKANGIGVRGEGITGIAGMSKSINGSADTWRCGPAGCLRR